MKRMLRYGFFVLIFFLSAKDLIAMQCPDVPDWVIKKITLSKPPKAVAGLVFHAQGSEQVLIQNQGVQSIVLGYWSDRFFEPFGLLQKGSAAHLRSKAGLTAEPTDFLAYFEKVKIEGTGKPDRFPFDEGYLLEANESDAKAMRSLNERKYQRLRPASLPLPKPRSYSLLLMVFSANGEELMKAKAVKKHFGQIGFELLDRSYLSELTASVSYALNPAYDEKTFKKMTECQKRMKSLH